MEGCDFTVQADTTNIPDIVVLERKERQCCIIGVACPIEKQVCKKEQRKGEIISTLRRRL